MVTWSGLLQPPEEPEEEVVQWSGSKTFEVTPVLKPLAASEGPIPMHMLPHKIQLRIAESPLQASKCQEIPDALLCKVSVCVCP